MNMMPSSTSSRYQTAKGTKSTFRYLIPSLLTSRSRRTSRPNDQRSRWPWSAQQTRSSCNRVHEQQQVYSSTLAFTIFRRGIVPPLHIFHPAAATPLPQLPRSRERHLLRVPVLSPSTFACGSPSSVRDRRAPTAARTASSRGKRGANRVGNFRYSELRTEGEGFVSTHDTPSSMHNRRPGGNVRLRTPFSICFHLDICAFHSYHPLSSLCNVTPAILLGALVACVP